MSSFTFATTALLLACAPTCHGHAYLAKPPARNALNPIGNYAINSGDSIFLRINSVQAHGGHRLSLEAEDGEVVHAKLHPEAQMLVIEKKEGDGVLMSGDKIFLRGSVDKDGKKNIKYISVEMDGHVHAKWDNKGDWETLKIEKIVGKGEILMGDRIALKGHTGGYITAVGNDVHADSTHRGAYQTFIVDSAEEGLTQTCHRNDDCAANAWCKDEAYHNWCHNQGEAGDCPGPVCEWRHDAALLEKAGGMRVHTQ